MDRPRQGRRANPLPPVNERREPIMVKMYAIELT